MEKNKSIVTPGLFLLLAAIARLIFSHSRDEIQNRESRMMSGIRNEIMKKETRNRTLDDSLIQDRGHVFLYTNDTTAQAGWIPNTPIAIGRVRSMVSPDNYEQLETDRNSHHFVLALNLADTVTYPLNENFVFNDSDTARRLYFMVFDSKNKMYKDSALLAEYPEAGQKFAATWGMAFNEISKLKVSNLVNDALKESVMELKELDGFYMYMVGVEKDNGHPGVNAAEFMQSVVVLNRFLNKSGMDTTHFRVKIL